MKVSLNRLILGVLTLLFSSVSMAAQITIVPNLPYSNGQYWAVGGQQFTVTLNATGFSNAGAGTMSIVWDTTKASFTHTNNTACAACLAPSGPVGTGTGTFVQVHLPTFDLLPGAPPVNGDFVAAQFTFQAIANGHVNLVINDDGGIQTGWFDNDTAEPFVVNYNQADIVVTPVPPAVWLFGSTLGVLGWMRRKISS